MYLISNLQRLPMNIKLCFTLEYWGFTYILGIGFCCFKFLTQALDHFSYNPANIPSWVLIRHYQMISQLHTLCNNNLGQKGFCSAKVPDTSLQAWSRKDKARIGQLITMYIVIITFGIWDLSKLCVGKLTRKRCLKKWTIYAFKFIMALTYLKIYILLASYLRAKPLEFLGKIPMHLILNYCIHFSHKFDHTIA